jgi:hypothetical protein
MATADITGRRRRAAHVARDVIPPTLAAEVAGSDGDDGEPKFHTLFYINNDI